MKRRQLFRNALSSFLGFNLAYFKSQFVRSENSPISKDITTTVTIVRGQIPSNLSLEYFQNILSVNSSFNQKYSHFVKRGFNFDTNLISFIDIQNTINQPFFATQLSGQRKKEGENNTLVEFVTLSSIYTNQGLFNLGVSGTILANELNKETSLINALVFYPFSNNLDKYEKIERDFLEQESPEAIADKIRNLGDRLSLNLTNTNSLSQVQKNQNLDFDTSFVLNNLDNFLFLMLSNQKNIQLSLNEFNHSDKYILEKLSQVNSIFIDQYKSEVEKLRTSFNKMTLLSSNKMMLSSSLVQIPLWLTWIITILTLIVLVVQIGIWIKDCVQYIQKQIQELTTTQEQEVKRNPDGTIESVKDVAPPVVTRKNIGKPFVVTIPLPNCTACGK